MTLGTKFLSGVKLFGISQNGHALHHNGVQEPHTVTIKKNRDGQVKNTHPNPMSNTMEGDPSSYLGITTMEPFQRYLSRVLTTAECICSKILTKYTLIHLLCSLLLYGFI